ncbi:MAG: 3-dehydroquinate synthase [Bacteroidetes bacterium HGW-Bacteroidetes-1]|jgi:3-dehydroquinate synthase|nr:MAG: 3-dehydroquinate synthase [Bacteroidetes bacterium HGW-Bacteroidetes-1]
MEQIKNVLFGQNAIEKLNEKLHSFKADNKKVFLLCDTNSAHFCKPVLNQLSIISQLSYETIVIPFGEENKNIDTVRIIWDALTRNGAGRDAVLFNLGGGMVTDIGGFTASCFKRGISTMHIPTTLLGMVDAAIGGKTGIDYGFLKNHIGTFYAPENVFIWSEFLSTLPKRELMAGYGEVLKYGFISDHALPDFDPLQQKDHNDWLEIIRICAEAKQRITLADPTENGQRKILNFGHTIGHSFESFALENGSDLLHGEAVACGMISELWLSNQLLGLPEVVLQKYLQVFKKHFLPFRFTFSSMDDLMVRMQHDKKNAGNEMRFVLIKNQGEPVYDVAVSKNLVKQSLEFYMEATDFEIQLT